MKIGEFVKGDTKLNQEHIRIIVDTECRERWQLFEELEEEQVLTLNDCLKIAKNELGYKGAGIVLVLSESFLNGVIYRYGNYQGNDEWEVAGVMHGFA